jgi:hypothetical protein
MYDRAFACVCDTRYLPGLWALLNSIAVYHGSELRVFVALHGRVKPPAIESLRRHPMRRLLDSTQASWSAWQRLVR